MPYDPASERFRIYTLDTTDAEPLILATCATPEDLGYALALLASEGEFDRKRVGVLDRRDPDRTGVWVINPFEGCGNRPHTPRMKEHTR